MQAATHTLPPASPHQTMAEIEASTIREVLLIVKGLKENIDGMRAELHTLIMSQNGRLSKIENDQAETRTQLAVSNIERQDMKDDIAFLQKVLWACIGFTFVSVAGLVISKLTGH